MNQKIRDAICDMGYEDAVVFDGPDFDDAIVGVSDDGRVIYDYDKMVRSMMQQDGIGQDEAIEFIEYNTIRACEYVKDGPIIMYGLTLPED